MSKSNKSVKSAKVAESAPQYKSAVLAILANNHFASAKVTKEQVGAESFKSYRTALESALDACYDVAVIAENSAITFADAGDKVIANLNRVDNKAVSRAFKAVTALCTAVSVGYERTIKCDSAMVLMLIAYSSRRVNKDSDAMVIATQELAQAKKALNEVINAPAVNGKYVKARKADVDKAQAKVNDLLAVADNRVKVVGRATVNAFAVEFEHLIARRLSGVQADDSKAINAARDAKRAARKAAQKARKDAAKAGAEQA